MTATHAAAMIDRQRVAARPSLHPFGSLHHAPPACPPSGPARGRRRLAALATAGLAAFRLVTAGESMTAAATAWLAGLDDVQRARATADFEAATRTDWHFIPKPIRKGLPLTDMTKPQRDLAHALLKSALSEAGYGKAMAIMELDELCAGSRGRRPKYP